MRWNGVVLDTQPAILRIARIGLGLLLSDVILDLFKVAESLSRGVGQLSDGLENV